MQLFAYYLDKMKSTTDGDATLLDQVAILYGSGMGNSNLHDPRHLPLLVAGGGAGTLKGGRHLRYPKETPLANLHVAMMDRMGVEVEKFGDSNGKLGYLTDL